MAMTIQDVATMSFSAQDPATLRELLTAGKKLPPDSTALLMQDHAEVKAMFRQFESEKQMKPILARKICIALTVHAEIEEEIFYPQAGTALEDDELITEAIEEHAEMKELIAKIIEDVAAEKAINRNIKALKGSVEHHVAEEESEMFPDMRQTDTDFYEIGKALAARRVEILLALKRQEKGIEAPS